MAINFYLDTRQNKKGEKAIRLSVCIEGARLLTNTGYSIFPSCWTGKTARTRKDSPANSKGYTAAKINSELSKIAAYWEGIEANPDNIVTVEYLQNCWNEYRGKKKPEEGRTAAALLRRYEAIEGRLWSEGTQTKWRCFLGLIEDSGLFQEEAGFTDPVKVAAFVDYLRKVRMQKEATVSKYFSMLCKVVRYGERQGDFPAGSAAMLKAGERFATIGQPVIYLTKEELFRFLDFDCSEVEGKQYIFNGHSHNLSPSTLERAKDLFCFCCLTSLRVSDGMALTWASVRENTLTVTTQKTAERITMPLNSRAAAILARRRESQGGSPDYSQKVFEPITLVTMNSYLKALGYLCGIDAPIVKTFVKAGRRATVTEPKYLYLSSHAARRTFIVTALSLGIPPAIVMKFTGHSSFASMKPYIDITEDAKAEAMAKFDTL